MAQFVRFGDSLINLDLVAVVNARVDTSHLDGIPKLHFYNQYGDVVEVVHLKDEKALDDFLSRMASSLEGAAEERFLLNQLAEEKDLSS